MWFLLVFTATYCLYRPQTPYFPRFFDIFYSSPDLRSSVYPVYLPPPIQQGKAGECGSTNEQGVPARTHKTYISIAQFQSYRSCVAEGKVVLVLN
jgi:hypothetical protein